MSNDTSGTFGGWSDRITWIIAEAQILVAGLLVSLGLVLLWARPSIPGVPPVAGGMFFALLLFGPPLFGLFVTIARALRRRNMVTVHEINAVEDTIEKWYVAPEVWSDKTVDGPTPYPVNGSSAWAVREFEHKEDLGELTVRGVWLSEVEDAKLMTSKSHMASVYSKLVESHLSLKIMRESVSELGTDIQERLINKGAEARERGTLLDKSAVKDVFEDFEDDVSDLGTDDLPTVDHADLPGDDLGDLADAAAEGPDPSMASSDQPTAADGGTTDD